VDWGNESAPPMLLIHGGRDHARNWDWVARDLRRDYHLIAPDLRGHGDSAWAIGGMYSQSEFVLDITQLVEALQLPPFVIVAHSMGGSVALQYTGTYPERVVKLIAIEGMGPPPEMLERYVSVPTWQRMQNWIEAMQNLASRTPRRYPSIDAAAQRMQDENPFLSPEQARHLTIHGVARNEDRTFSWKFDNYVRAFGPYRFDLEEMKSIWSRITCPTLLVRGKESWASDPEEDGRLQYFQNARAVTIDGAGHWVHHDRLDEFIRLVRDFLDE
jgi:pimeloyl-ACP methyl ester carboxylesterase